MKNYPIKLKCPMCNVEFITNRTDKIWCNKSCSVKYLNIAKDIKINKSYQKRMMNDAYSYNFETDKFSIASLMPQKQNKL